MRLFHALTTLAVLVALATASLDFPVKHVIVLQLENRSFDHMCGYLKRVNPGTKLTSTTPHTHLFTRVMDR